jgi:hypothetical protein
LAACSSRATTARSTALDPYIGASCASSGPEHWPGDSGA